MTLPPWSSSPSQWFVLVTGANGGLGYSSCERTISEHFTTPSRPSNQALVLIISTRSATKTRATIAKLRLFLRRYAESSSYAMAQEQRLRFENGEAYTWQSTQARVHFLGVELDLCNLRRVYDAAARIRGDDGVGGLDSPDFQGLGMGRFTIPRLDALVLNAGMIGIEGIRWGPAVWDTLVNTTEALTYWEHNIPSLGRRVGRQLVGGVGSEVEEGEEEPVLGEVFCSNVFGHYVLTHELMSLLQSRRPGNARAEGDRGRVIWISSLEALDDSFDIEDLQALRSDNTTTDPYRSSKRLTDILVLTANLPSVKPISAPFFETMTTTTTSGAKTQPYSDDDEKEKPGMYLAHPGICATTIIPLPLILTWGMLLGFYLARFLGSVWHTISTFKGAVAVSWLILADTAFIDSCEGEQGKTKWGSSTDRFGEERVRPTWVPGWGFGGTALEDWKSIKGVKRGTKEWNRDDRESFEDIGRKVWTEMEELRLKWQTLLGR